MSKSNKTKSETQKTIEEIIDDYFIKLPFTEAENVFIEYGLQGIALNKEHFFVHIQVQGVLFSGKTVIDYTYFSLDHTKIDEMMTKSQNVTCMTRSVLIRFGTIHVLQLRKVESLDVAIN